MPDEPLILRDARPPGLIVVVRLGSKTLADDQLSQRCEASFALGGDMVVECWISHGPRAGDPAFDPQPGDWVTAGDDEEPPRQARVVRRQDNRVWIQFDLPRSANQVA